MAYGANFLRSMNKRLTSPDALDVLAMIGAESGGHPFGSVKPISLRNYVICMLPRTGSTMLCSVLERTALLGYPDEYLNPRGVVQLYAHRYLPRSLQDYIDILRRERSTANGVFGLKASFDDFRPVIDAGLVNELFGPARFIYLDRKDLALQAVSAFVAQQSGIWHRDATGVPFRSHPTAEPSFDEEAILSNIDSFARARAAWEEFFVSHSISPVRLTYESVVADIGKAVRQIADTVGAVVDIPVDLSMSTTSKLADDRSYEWAERIRKRHQTFIGDP